MNDMYFESGEPLDGWNLISAGVEIAFCEDVSGEEGGVRVAMLGVDFAVSSLLVDVNSLLTVCCWWIRWWW